MQIIKIPHPTPDTPNKNWASSTLPQEAIDTDTNPQRDPDAASDPIEPEPTPVPADL